MLDKPALPDEALIACLQENYALQNPRLEFLPRGADRNAAVYRAVVSNHISYFVKLKQGFFNEPSVLVPGYLSSQGIRQVIAPLLNRSGMSWTDLAGFTVILYPYIEGRDGYQVELSDRHWIELGQTIRRIHATVLPVALAGKINRETYSPRGRETVRLFLARAKQEIFNDPVAIKLAVFLQAKQAEILALVERAEQLAQALLKSPPDNVLCHSDLHAGNILIDGSNELYIVDWDEPIFAPKERDLMFAGGGQGFRGHTAGEEEALFHQGYGPVKLDPVALAYYRYERIIQDIAAFSGQILSSENGGSDREQSYQYLTSNFLPGNTLEIAYRTDRTDTAADRSRYSE